MFLEHITMFLSLIGSISYEFLRITSTFIEQVYYTGLDVVGYKNNLRGRRALIVGGDESSIAINKRLIQLLLKRGIDVVIVINGELYRFNAQDQKSWDGIENMSMDLKTKASRVGSFDDEMYDGIDIVEKAAANITKSLEEDTIDILILNHLIDNRSDKSEPNENQRIKNVIDNNLTLTSILTRSFIPDMTTNQFGKIVYVDKIPKNDDMITDLSKSGIACISQSTRKELGDHNITVSHVEIDASSHPDQKQFYAGMISDAIIYCIDYNLKSYRSEPMLYLWIQYLIRCSKIKNSSK